jgi:hypothetical protein
VFRNIYILCLGILLGIIVTTHISFAYSAPKVPEYPADLNEGAAMYDTQGAPVPGSEGKAMEIQKKYEADMKSYSARQGEYSFTVNLAKVIVAVLLIMVGALVIGRLPLLPEAAIAGGAIVLLSLSSSFFSFYGFDVATYGDSSFKVSIHQLGTLYAITIIAAVVGFLTFKKPAK